MLFSSSVTAIRLKNGFWILTESGCQPVVRLGHCSSFLSSDWEIQNRYWF